MPTFCRHNRFIERCPICRRTLPGAAGAGASGAGRSHAGGAGVKTGGGTGGGRSSGSAASPGADSRSAADATGGRGRSSRAGSSPGGGGAARRLRAGGQEVRVRREARSEDDGYVCGLVPGLHASADAARLAEEIAFASGRLGRMHAAPPDLYGELRALAGDGELERATWMCFLAVYLSPLQGEDPFAGVRMALERERVPRADAVAAEHRGDWSSPLDGVPLGPRTSHDPARGTHTLRAYRQWALGAGSQERAFVGEESWTPARRFERAFERLALPGFARAGRYELLVTLGRLGLYELQPGSLHLATGRGVAADDLTTVAAKRILAVGEPIYLERRAEAFARDLAVPIDVLDLAFANWAAPERATLGFKADVLDHHTLDHVRQALGLQEK